MSNGSGLTPGPTGALDLDSEEGRAFLQERLALFGMVGFLVQFGFFALSWLVLSFVVPELVFGRWPLAKIGMVAGDLLGQGLYLLLWLYARRGRRRLAVLRFLDILLPLLTCSASALALHGKGVGYGAPFAILLIIMTALMARAVIVPSSPKRTLKLGLACVLPLLVTTAGLRLPTPIFGPQVRDLPFLVPGAMWSACAVILSTFTSAVIFGLRRRVSEARRLGQYTLEHKLGEGGMGAVYRASHAMLRRPTAIKLLPPERSGRATACSASSARCRRRRCSATRTRSRSTTTGARRTVSSTTRWSTSRASTSRPRAPATARSTPGRVVHVLRQVAGALGEAHGVGLIHRDVKPGEHHPVRAGRRARRREGRGLRPGARICRRRPAADDPSGLDLDGHAALPVARGDHGAGERGRAQRPLRPGRGGLLPARRPPSLRGRHGGRGLHAPPAHEAGAALRAARRAAARGARGR